MVVSAFTRALKAIRTTSMVIHLKEKTNEFTKETSFSTYNRHYKSLKKEKEDWEWEREKAKLYHYLGNLEKKPKAE